MPYILNIILVEVHLAWSIKLCNHSHNPFYPNIRNYCIFIYIMRTLSTCSCKDIVTAHHARHIPAAALHYNLDLFVLVAQEDSQYGSI